MCPCERVCVRACACVRACERSYVGDRGGGGSVFCKRSFVGAGEGTCAIVPVWEREWGRISCNRSEVRNEGARGVGVGLPQVFLFDRSCVVCACGGLLQAFLCDSRCVCVCVGGGVFCKHSHAIDVWVGGLLQAFPM